MYGILRETHPRKSLDGKFLGTRTTTLPKGIGLRLQAEFDCISLGFPKTCVSFVLSSRSPSAYAQADAEDEPLDCRAAREWSKTTFVKKTRNDVRGPIARREGDGKLRVDPHRTVCPGQTKGLDNA